MADNRTIGEKIASAYRPFLASKPVGPVDDIVNALGKDIDNNMKRLFWRSEEWRDVAYKLYMRLTTGIENTPLDQVAIDAYSKALDNDTSSDVPDLATLQIRLRDLEAIAADLYGIVEGEYPECDLQEMNCVQKYKKYKQVTEIVDGAKYTTYKDIKTLDDNADNRQDKGAAR